MAARFEIAGVRISLIAVVMVLAGFVAGVRLSTLLADRQARQQRSELRTRTVMLLKSFEEIAGADSLAHFSNGVSDISRSVEAFSQLSFPRMQPLRDEMVGGLFAATSSFLDAAICWAEYEDPGRSRPGMDSAEGRLSQAPSETLIDAKRSELEQRTANATSGSNLALRIAERRAALAREREESRFADSRLAGARAIAESQRMAEVRLAAAECVQQRRAEGLNKVGEIYGLLDIRL